MTRCLPWNHCWGAWFPGVCFGIAFCKKCPAEKWRHMNDLERQAARIYIGTFSQMQERTKRFALIDRRFV